MVLGHRQRHLPGRHRGRITSYNVCYTKLLRVLSTPGHTAGSLSYYFPAAKCVFVGDLVFYRSIGRTDFPGGNMEQLLDSVRTQIFTLPPETELHAGHMLSTTVHDEMLHNPYFRD